MRRKKKHHKRTDDYSAAENRGSSQRTERLTVGAILLILAGATCLPGYMLSLDMRHKPAAVAVFFVAWIVFGLAVAVPLWLEYREQSKSESNRLDKATPPPLPTPMRTAPELSPSLASTPSTTRPPKTSSPTPIPTSTSRPLKLTPDNIRDKLRDAEDSIDSRRAVADLQKALSGMPVDWTGLRFSSATRHDDRKVMAVYLYSEGDMLVVANLPIAGNEQMPLMDRTDVFRLRGKISNVETLAIDVTDATLEYVGSGKKK